MSAPPRSSSTKPAGSPSEASSPAPGPAAPSPSPVTSATELRSVAQVGRQPTLSVELLQVGLHDQGGGRADLGGDVVPDLGQQRVAGARAGLAGGEQAAAAAVAG